MARTVTPVILAMLTLSGTALTATGQPTIYWSNTLAGSLQRTVVGSDQIEEVVEGFVDRPQNLRLDLAQNRLYWSLPVQSPSPNNAIVQRSNLDGSDLENIILSGYCDPYCPISAMGLDADRDSLYWFTWDGNGPLPRHDLYRSGADGSDVTFLGTADHVVTDVVLDGDNEQMYWFEVNFPERTADHAIRRATLSGTEVERLLQVGDGTPPRSGHLAVDEAGGKLYWVTDNRAIRRANLDGSDIEDVVTAQGDPDSTRFGDIAVDTGTGKLYWVANYGGLNTFPVGVIHRVNLDGTEAETLVRLDPATIGAFAIDFSGSVDREDVPVPPSQLALEAAYPNPAQSGSRIGFTLSSAAQVRITLYDVLGRKVKMLDDSFRAAGRHEIDIATDDLPSGLYVYRLEGRNGAPARTLTVMR